MQITPTVHQLHAIGCDVFALLGEQVTLIDAGWPGSGWLVLRQLRKLGRQPEEVERIVLTHYHIELFDRLQAHHLIQLVKVRLVRHVNV